MSMPTSTAHVATDRPERSIEQLISHLTPDVTADLGHDGRATLTLAQGQCVLTPAGDHLTLIATATDPVGLAGVQDAVTRHLVGSAAPSELRVDWTAPVAGDALQLVDPVVGDYLLTHCTPADEVLTDLVAATREAAGGAARMQIAQDEGALLGMLVRLVGARRAVEVGVFTGYSSICVARALPEDGYLLACDVSTEWTSVAREYWKRAGVADRIDLRIGPAIETLRALPADETFDFAFIDADKVSYPDYYEEIVPRLRPGGLVVLDNVFQGGRTFDPAFHDENHVAMRRMNEIVVRDDRVESVMLAVRDGVTLARKR
jgi:predicted O-methyltransferase YrrM